MTFWRQGERSPMSTPAKLSAPLSPSLQPGTQSGTIAAAQAMLPRVISLKNSLLPTSFLCRVMSALQPRAASPSSLLPISGMPHETATPQQWHMWPEVLLQQRSSLQVLKSPPVLVPNCRVSSQGQRELGRFYQSGWSTRQKHEVPARWLRENNSFPNAHSPPLPLIPPQCHRGSTLLEKLNQVLSPDEIVLLITR